MAQRLNPNDIGNVSSKPYQTHHISFPPQVFGKQCPVQCLFQSSWFAIRLWLQYNIAQDVVLYFTCSKVVKDGLAMITGCNKCVQGNIIQDSQ